MELDEAVDRLGTAVGRACGVEVRQERLPPLLQRAPETGDLWDRAGRRRGDDVLGDPAALSGVLLVEHRAQLVAACHAMWTSS